MTRMTVMAHKNNVGTWSDVVAADYKKGSLRIAADKLGCTHVSLLRWNDKENCMERVCLKDGFYSVWSNGVCVFAERGQEVAAADSI